jgi:dihydroflavonol-4-reductase
MILTALNRQVPGYVDSGANYVDIEELARGHILAAQKGRIGERYILGNEDVPIKEFL